MSILKHVSGSNKDPDYKNTLIDYLTENHKTADGQYVDTYGCSKTAPLRDMNTVCKVHHKTNGKQAEHFVLSVTPDKKENTNASYMEIGRRISSYFDGFQSVFALHTDTSTRHLHFLINSVSYKDGRKFSQGPTELNNFKTYCNHVLHENGFDIIKKGNNELFDDTPHSLKNGFDFLEVSEDEPQECAEASPVITDNNYVDQYDNNDYYIEDNYNDYDDYEEDDNMSKCYTPEVTDSNDKKLKKKSKKKGKKKSKRTYTIDNSCNYTVKVDSRDKLKDAADFLSSLHKKSLEEKIENTKLGMCAVTGFNEKGIDVDVHLNDSQNFTIEFDYSNE